MHKKGFSEVLIKDKELVHSKLVHFENGEQCEA